MRANLLAISLLLLLGALSMNGAAYPDIYPINGYHTIVIDNTWGDKPYTVKFYMPDYASKTYDGSINFAWYPEDIMSTQTVRAGEKKFFSGKRVIHSLNHNKWHGVVAVATDPHGWEENYWIDP